MLILFGCSFTKATVKPNVQLVAPCQCLGTGQQVKYPLTVAVSFVLFSLLSETKKYSLSLHM